MAEVFEHADGRIMVDEGVAGGSGGGFVHRFHRLATEAEAAAFRALKAAEVAVGMAPVELEPPVELAPANDDQGDGEPPTAA